LRSTTKPLQYHERTFFDYPGFCLFGLLTLAGIVTAILAYRNGDVHMVTRPHDSFGNICGEDNSDQPRTLFSLNSQRNTSLRPFLFQFSPTGVRKRSNLKNINKRIFWQTVVGRRK
jgi:hypothetical protein